MTQHLPFHGILATVHPTRKAVGARRTYGSHKEYTTGKKMRLVPEFIRAQLRTLVGKPVRLGHWKRRCGRITGAIFDGEVVRVTGYLTQRLDLAAMGMSVEIRDVLLGAPGSSIYHVIGGEFAGAAILPEEKAACAGTGVWWG